MKRQGRYVGRRPDWKKAYVVLKKGEKMVEFFDQAIGDNGTQAIQSDVAGPALHDRT